MNHEISPRDNEISCSLGPSGHPQALQSVALAVAEARSVETVLSRIVLGLLAQEGVALARIWLIAPPGDICASCPMRSECPDQSRCLHLVASAGKPAMDTGEDWSRLNGDFRRFPLNVRKVGRVGGSGEPILASTHLAESPWIARPDWVRREGLVSFAGQPLIFRGEILGGVQSCEIREAQCEWLRTVADHAAVAIANARRLPDSGPRGIPQRSRWEGARTELGLSQGVTSLPRCPSSSNDPESRGSDSGHLLPPVRGALLLWRHCTAGPAGILAGGLCRPVGQTLPGGTAARGGAGT